MRQTASTTTMTRRRACALAAMAVAGSLPLAACASGTNAKEPEPAADAASDEIAQTDTADAAEQPAEEPVKGSTFAYNTLVSIIAYGVDQDVVNESLKMCADYENLFSARKEGTDIARINEAKGAPVEVDPRTADLLAEALSYCEESEGLFDITIGAVTLLWDFMLGVRPTDDAIAQGLRHVDYTKVKLDGTTVTLEDPDARIDLGGIAKGWISRELGAFLAEKGATAAMVNLGTSSIMNVGTKPDGQPWRVGLRDPANDEGGILGIVELGEEAITSSGLYDQRFELDGQTYWHILDPKTGMPAQTDMLGDTLICDDPAMGDAVSTMLFVMGIEKASEWVAAHHPEMAAMFVGQDDEPVYVNGFEDYLAAEENDDAQ